MPLLFGIRPQWFPWQPDAKPSTLTHGLYGTAALTELALPQCLLGVSRSLQLLLDKEPWSSQTQKVRTNEEALFMERAQFYVTSL